MNKKEKAKIILEKLNDLYPDPSPPLNSINSFTLLIAVLLSAQSTDKKVNELTKELFIKASSPNKMYELGELEIFNKINKIGLAKTKAKNIHKLSKILIDKYDQDVPRTFAELESLPGVGHKTASVVMSQAFNFNTFPVDTHIHRLAQRWELTNGLSVKQTELDLKKLFSPKDWNKLHLQIIFYGREYCTARSCDGRNCELCQTLCPNRKKPFKHKKA